MNLQPVSFTNQSLCESLCGFLHSKYQQKTVSKHNSAINSMKFCLIIDKPEGIKANQPRAGWAETGQTLRRISSKQELIWDGLKASENEGRESVKPKESRRQQSAAPCQGAQTGSLCVHCLEKEHWDLWAWRRIVDYPRGSSSSILRLPGIVDLR